MDNLVKEVRKTLAARLTELEPMVAEYEQVRESLAALDAAVPGDRKAVSAAGRTRRRRSDAGKKRGPGRPRKNSTSQTSATKQGSDEGRQAEPAPETVAPSGPSNGGDPDPSPVGDTGGGLPSLLSRTETDSARADAD